MAKLPTWASILIAAIGGLELVSVLVGAWLGHPVRWLDAGLAAVAVAVFGPVAFVRARSWRAAGGRIDWRSVLWPYRKNPTPSLWTWLGRVQHWLSVAWAFVFGAALLLSGLVNGLGYLASIPAAAGFLVFACIGRAARYVLAKE